GAHRRGGALTGGGELWPARRANRGGPVVPGVGGGGGLPPGPHPPLPRRARRGRAPPAADVAAVGAGIGDDVVDVDGPRVGDGLDDVADVVVDVLCDVARRIDAVGRAIGGVVDRACGAVARARDQGRRDQIGRASWT